MTNEEKQLLLVDLCGRLPYHVRCKIWLEDGTTEEGPLDLQHNYGDVLQDAFFYHRIKDIKPYLRPMSSMMKEEKCQFRKFVDWTYDCNWKSNTIEGILNENRIVSKYAIELFDWLNAHHFDYRGLIPIGLALEAPEGMYD